jgi:transcriptional regulator with XRE-family HTH domain
LLLQQLSINQCEVMMARLTKLKAEILNRRMIQADIAEDLGISETRLSRIVNGRTEPNESERASLAAALGLAWSALTDTESKTA